LLRRIPAVPHILRWGHRTLLKLYPRAGYLRREFNRWAIKGWGESMELDHTWLAERTIPEMTLSCNDRVLDLGCGDGWACRFIAKHLEGCGHIVGLDISDEMVRQARIRSSQVETLAFVCASAQRIPCRDQSFSKVLSVSAFYYFEQQEKVLTELLRVVAPEGYLFLLTCLYKDLPDWRSSKRYLRVPVHVHSAHEYECMLRAAGWTDVYSQELLRGSDACGPTPGHDRALLVRARRPRFEKNLGLQIASQKDGIQNPERRIPA
jgi:ubiquinone/menaquinone biosynthesis C-methylase UbiE